MVSGYSGGDIVACQAAGAMNMNKGFWLPANFCLLETANDKGEALALPGIQDRRIGSRRICYVSLHTRRRHAERRAFFSAVVAVCTTFDVELRRNSSFRVIGNHDRIANRFR